METTCKGKVQSGVSIKKERINKSIPKHLECF